MTAETAPTMPNASMDAARAHAAAPSRRLQSTKARMDTTAENRRYDTHMRIGRNTNAAAAFPATAKAKRRRALVMPLSSAAIPQATDTGNIIANAEPANDAEPYVARAAFLKGSFPKATQITEASPPTAANAPVITPNHIRAFRPKACLTPTTMVETVTAVTNGKKPETPTEPGIMDTDGSFTAHTVFSAS